MFATAVGLLLVSIPFEAHDETEIVAGDVAAGGDPYKPRGMQGLLVFVHAGPPDFGDANAAREFTRSGLDYLASAITEIIAAEGSRALNVHVTIIALRQSVNALSAPASARASAPRHARPVRAALDRAVAAMSAVQQTHFPEAAGEISALRAVSERFAPDQPLPLQRSAVKSFFDAAATALQAMVDSATPRESPWGRAAPSSGRSPSPSQ